MEERKSLLSILGETAIYTIACYPILAGIRSSIDENLSFIDVLQHPITVPYVLGMGVGYGIAIGGIELTNRYLSNRQTEYEIESISEPIKVEDKRPHLT